MDYTAAGRRCKKENKENCKPANRVQSFIKNKPAVQFHQKINQKKLDDVKSKQPDGKDTTDGTPLHRGRQAAAASENGPKDSQAFLTEQQLKVEKTVREFSKPPLSVVASKPRAGMYNGKIVQSKIACIWKFSSTVERAQAALSTSTLKYQSPKSTNFEKKVRPKSVFGSPVHMPRSVATSCPPIGSSCSSARPLLATLTSISYGNPDVGSARTQKLKPKVSEPDKMVSKSHSNIYSLNRFAMETKERRAKLAEWQASKGKTLKRPAMKIAETKVLERKQVKSHAEPDTRSKPKDFLKAQEVESPGPFLMPHKSVESQHMNDLFVKHSALTEVTVASPRREDDSAQVINVSNHAKLEDGKPKDECRHQLKYETKNVGKKLQVAQVKIKKQSLAVMDKEIESRKERVIEPMPQRENTSMVKYSVTTTPYLQSVKKTLDDARASASKETGNIKDFKFLTPVRRSCRIQCKSSHLPAMLQDHDPCVKSLAELVTLDDSLNAFIYRKNPALTEYVRPAKTEIS